MTAWHAVIVGFGWVLLGGFSLVFSAAASIRDEREGRPRG